MYVYIVCVVGHMWRPYASSKELVLSFYISVDSGKRGQGTRLV